MVAVALLAATPLAARAAPPDVFLTAQRELLDGGMDVAAQVAAAFGAAAEQGNAVAEYDLGYCYEHGIGVSEDPIQAVRLYRRAAEHATDDDLRAIAQSGAEDLQTQSVFAELTETVRGTAADAATLDAPAPVAAVAEVAEGSPVAADAMPAPAMTLALAMPPEAPRSAAPSPAIPVLARPASPPVAAPPPEAPLPAAVVDSLLERGDATLRRGDVAAARLLYGRAAKAGSVRALALLGMSYDPRFLSQIGVRGPAPDAASAASFYRRAAGRGDADATRLLAGLAVD